MAGEKWYALRVRPGFQTLAAKKLRQLNLEVVVPDDSSPPEYLYCRFTIDRRSLVTSVSGVLEILGAPEPKPIDVSVRATRAKVSR